MPQLLPPSKMLLLTEGLRGTVDLARLAGAWPRLSKRLPSGHGDAVLVLPGFMAGNGSTAILRRILRKLGYRVEGWRLGRNLGLRAGVLEGISAQLEEMASRSGASVSIIGQSLGGTFAREIAKPHPALVKQVITLGSPFAGSPRATNAWRLYEWASGEKIEASALMAQLRSPPPVPTTSIYSRTDGVVAWQTSMESAARNRENIEVRSSHIGMAVHPGAIVVIADRLEQAGTWSPFKPKDWSAHFFPRAASVSASSVAARSA